MIPCCRFSFFINYLCVFIHNSSMVSAHKYVNFLSCGSRTDFVGVYDHLTWCVRVRPEWLPRPLGNTSSLSQSTWHKCIALLYNKLNVNYSKYLFVVVINLHSENSSCTLPKSQPVWFKQVFKLVLYCINVTVFLRSSFATWSWRQMACSFWRYEELRRKMFWKVWSELMFPHPVLKSSVLVFLVMSWWSLLFNFKLFMLRHFPML